MPSSAATTGATTMEIMLAPTVPTVRAKNLAPGLLQEDRGRGLCIPATLCSLGAMQRKAGGRTARNNEALCRLAAYQFLDEYDLADKTGACLDRPGEHEAHSRHPPREGPATEGTSVPSLRLPHSR